MKQLSVAARAAIENNARQVLNAELALESLYDHRFVLGEGFTDEDTMRAADRYIALIDGLTFLCTRDEESAQHFMQHKRMLRFETEL